jgi:hypothetical protein
VFGAFELLGEAVYGFKVGAYDPSREFVIDPTLRWLRYVGGTFQDYYCNAVTTDADGNVYVTGGTRSGDMVMRTDRYWIARIGR